MKESQGLTYEVYRNFELFLRVLGCGAIDILALIIAGDFWANNVFNKVFYSRYKVNRVELVKRIGIRLRETNNIVERLHETVKERTRLMRGFKNADSASAILDGYVVNYNFARPHLSLKGKTPAQQAGIEVKGWKNLIENAIQKEALNPQSQERIPIAPLQVVR